MVVYAPIEEYPRIRAKLMQLHRGFSYQWMPFAKHNHERVLCEASGRYQCVRRRRCNDGKVELMVLKVAHQLKRVGRDDFDYEVLMEA
jgi:hypothetical protein